MFLIFYFHVSLLILFTVIAAGAEYSTYELFEVTAFNAHERSLLYEMHTTQDSLTFINGITNEAIMPMQVIVEKSTTDNFRHTLEQYGIEYSEAKVNSRTEKVTKVGFLKWENIKAWIEREQKKNPMLKKTILSYTYEKREIFTLSIVTNKNNPSAVIVAGEQGKDWMSPAIILSLIKYILGDKNLLNDYNFYFFPILNPDGYVFSMEKDEYWAKNRKVLFPHKTCTNQGQYIIDYTAVGVNLERNWYFDKIPTADNTCSSIYPGHKPLSEEETHTLAAFLNSHASKLMAFINVIGFGNRLITIPYSKFELRSVNHGVVMEIIAAACDQVFEEHKVTYFHGTSARFFCNCADWVKMKLNIPIVYTVYMKYEDEIIPKIVNVVPLSQQLTTIIRDTLTISKEIYKPLFSNCHNYHHTQTLIITLLLIMF